MVVVVASIDELVVLPKKKPWELVVVTTPGTVVVGSPEELVVTSPDSVVVDVRV